MTDPQKKTLNPCPFCWAGVPHQYRDPWELPVPFSDDSGRTYIECGYCGARTGYYDTIEEACAAWNNAGKEEAQILNRLWEVVYNFVHNYPLDGPCDRFPQFEPGHIRDVMGWILEGKDLVEL